MSEPNTPSHDGGLKQPSPPEPSDDGLSKTGGGEVRDGSHPNDVERGDPGAREGGMLGEG